jgi:hypothetical protein
MNLSIKPFQALENAFNNCCLSSAFNEQQYGKPTKESLERLIEARKNVWTFTGSSENYFRSEVDHYLKEHNSSTISNKS